VKAEELRELDAEELSGRLKGARRELFELRFRMAVGQLENPQQIQRVRKDIARILTVVHERLLDVEVQRAYGSAEAFVETVQGETPEQVETAAGGVATLEAEAPETDVEASDAGDGEAAEKTTKDEEGE
jgi:large subunit ribosomal protein L29